MLFVHYDSSRLDCLAYLLLFLCIYVLNYIYYIIQCMILLKLENVVVSRCLCMYLQLIMQMFQFTLLHIIYIYIQKSRQLSIDGSVKANDPQYLCYFPTGMLEITNKTLYNIITNSSHQKNITDIQLCYYKANVFYTLQICFLRMYCNWLFVILASNIL